MQSLILVLLVVARSQAARLTSTGVDLEPFFQFLDDDDSNCICPSEFRALTNVGDANDDKVITAYEFERTWDEVVVPFGIPLEKHAKYFELIDGIDGSGDDGLISESEEHAMFSWFDKDQNNEVDFDEFFEGINSVVS